MIETESKSGPNLVIRIRNYLIILRKIVTYVTFFVEDSNSMVRSHLRAMR